MCWAAGVYHTPNIWVSCFITSDVEPIWHSWDVWCNSYAAVPPCIPHHLNNIICTNSICICFSIQSYITHNNMLYILSYIHNCTIVPTVPPGHQRTIPYCSVFEHFSEPSELIFILALQTDSCVICKSVTDSDWPFESLRGYFFFINWRV